jgi:hypothetical protein
MRGVCPLVAHREFLMIYMNPLKTSLAVLFVALISVAGPAAALEPAKNKPVLTVSGKVADTNDAGKAVFDMAMLEALPQTSFTTATPWYNKPVKFTGPLLSDVLKAAGAKGTSLKAVAINDYKIQIPADDTRHGVILARLVDDKPLSVRDRGPLFVVYPFDSAPELRNATYFGRSIWQLKSIEVE